MKLWFKGNEAEKTLTLRDKDGRKLFFQESGNPYDLEINVAGYVMEHAPHLFSAKPPAVIQPTPPPVPAVEPNLTPELAAYVEAHTYQELLAELDKRGIKVRPKGGKPALAIAIDEYDRAHTGKPPETVPPAGTTGKP